MLDHEKRNRVTRAKVKRMVDLVNNYQAEPAWEDESSAVPEDDFGIRGVEVEEAPTVRCDGPAQGAGSQGGKSRVVSPAYLGSPTSTIDPMMPHAQM